jgi:DNA mismatch endonuclease, patch repair protein
MDYRTAEARSALMARIRSKNTKPELLVRSIVHRMGYRFRLHYSGLPGKPDLAFPSTRKAIFVHGCFWHSHGCRTGQPPKSRLEFWGPKLNANKARDRRDQEDLATQGWRVLVVWQCEVRDRDVVATKLGQFLGGSTMHQSGRREATRARRRMGVSPE